MENMSILTDFPEREAQQYYKKVAENLAGGYTVYTGGNYIYISNSKNRTIRFSSAGIKAVSVTVELLGSWLKNIHLKYPQF